MGIDKGTVHICVLGKIILELEMVKRDLGEKSES